MQRRTFLGMALLAAVPKMKITRIRYWEPQRANPTFNQSTRIVTVETDAGITGVGEGGSKDMLDQCAGMLIGEDPSRIEHLWQVMYRGFFYPPGREKLHALGALDLAMWDIKGKALGIPVYELLGGLTREHVECYSTGFPRKGTIGETAKACLEAGFRGYRTDASDGQGPEFQSRRAVDRTVEKCKEIREAIGKEGDWLIDFHTRFDLPDAVRLANLLEPLNPFLVEDPVRSENPGVLRNVRQQVKVPIAVGEQFGARWDINELVEGRLIDFSRVTIPNAGGLTEFLRIAALCETHYVGLVPHFTGPVSLAALVHALGTFPGPVLMEISGAEPRLPPHLKAGAEFKGGKLWPNQRPGLGVEFDEAETRMISEITTKTAPIPTYRRRDGSYTNW